jgi:hypothetical protein
VLTDKLIPLVKQRFGGRAVSYGKPPAPCVVFAAEHPAVGDIKLFDDGSEVILVAGHFTHGHFSDFTSKSAEQAEKNIAEDVVAFLELLFADQVVMWGTQSGGGGWYVRSSEASALVPNKGPLFVWSGPLTGG